MLIPLAVIIRTPVPRPPSGPTLLDANPDSEMRTHAQRRVAGSIGSTK